MTEHVTITGHPLTAPLTVKAEADDYILDEGWLLTRDTAQHVIEAWCSSPTRNTSNGADEALRSWSYSELGLFVTALY